MCQGHTIELGIKKKFPQIKKAWETVGQKKIGKSKLFFIRKLSIFFPISLTI